MNEMMNFENNNGNFDMQQLMNITGQTAMNVNNMSKQLGVVASVVKNGKGKKTVANEDVGDTLVLNQKDICYYFVDGDVYASSNGRKGKLVVAEADELDATPNGIVYIETDDATYATKTAKKPKKTYTND